MATWMRVVEWVPLAWQSLQQGRLPAQGFWVYPVVSLLTAIEGPWATLLASAASAAGLARPGWVFVSAATGNLAADTLWYTLGRAGRPEWVARLGGRFGLDHRRIDHLRHRMQRHAPQVVFVAKLTEGFIIPTLVVAGLSRVQWRRWLPPLVAAEVIWTGTLVLIGYHAVEAAGRARSAAHYLSLAAAVVAALVGLWWLRRAWLAREAEGAAVADGDGE